MTRQLTLSFLTGLAMLLAACGTEYAPTTPSAVVSPMFNANDALPVGMSVRAPAGDVSARGAAAIEWACAAASAFRGADCPALPAVLSTTAFGAAAAEAAPASPTGATGIVTGQAVRLDWQAPATGDPATSFVVEAGTGPGRADITTFETGNSNTSLTVQSVPPGTYYVRIRGRNSVGLSGPSNEVTLVVGATSGCTGAPAAPPGLARTLSGSVATLRWGISPAAISYIVEAGVSPGSSALATTDVGPATSLTSPALSPGTYYVRVRARNACGVSPASNEVSFTVGGGTGGSYDGAWRGLTGQARELSFTVVANALTRLVASYAIQGGFCSLTGTTTTTFNTPLRINGGSFFHFSGGQTEITVDGTFLSDTRASGALIVSQHPSFSPFVASCSGTVRTTWTASKQ